MKHSIRIRFTLIFVGLTAVILAGIWCANNWMLEEYYIQEKVSVLQQAYDDMDQLVLESAEAGGSIGDEFKEKRFTGYGWEQEQTPAVQLFRTLNDQYNITIMLMDSASSTIIGASAKDENLQMEKAIGYILGYTAPRTEKIIEKDNYTIQRTYDTRSKSFYLESWGFFSDDSTVFIMSTPLASIRESVVLSNRFLAYLGFAALSLSCLIVYLTTKKVTSPILALANLSEKMSQLDFEAKYQGDAQDEIGVLGNSMNALSDKLKDTIGELKAANIELQKDIEEKIQVDEMRKDFIANVSHELKTPIALIQGYAEGLTEGMAEDKDSRDYYCEVIVDEANKMNKMVRQLLTLTALEFGNDAVAMDRFNVVELIQGVVDAAGILIQQRGAQIEFDASQPVYVWADEFKIEEVVTNYLSNALNHVSEEGLIRINIQRMEATVRISVWNEGSPIPEDDLPNIWTKFYKVDKARTREYGGSGIGLSIVKAIMDSHHGECGVSNMGNGVEFWFTLDSKDEV